jgi:NAD+ synthase
LDNQQLKEQIPEWMSNYLSSTSLDGFIVGISGGIDSALTSTLCALTGKPTHVVSLPIYQKPEQLSRAHKHQNWLVENFENVTIEEFRMDFVYGSFRRMFEEDNDHALANTRSRLRMTALYHLASIHNLLVVGTGNKVEDFGVGFYTKYGDGGVDISPIGDLLKTEVRELSQELGILQEIIDAPPTDGLWDDGRTDEDQMGATYEELEWAMSYDPQKGGLLSNRQKDVLDIYNTLHKQNKHKMNPIPVFQK